MFSGSQGEKDLFRDHLLLTQLLTSPLMHKCKINDIADGTDSLYRPAFHLENLFGF